MPETFKLFTDAEGVIRGYYVYLHKDRATGAVFYVGKGNGRRAWKTDGRHPDWYSKVASLTAGWDVEIAREDLSELEAFDLEKELVKKHGGCQGDGGTLVNIWPGGEPLASACLEFQFDDGGWSAAYEGARKFKDFPRAEQEQIVGELEKELGAIIAILDKLRVEADQKSDEKLTDNVVEIDCILGTVGETCSDFRRRRVPWRDFALTLEEAYEDLESEAAEISAYYNKMRPLVKRALEITKKTLAEIDTGNSKEAEEIANRSTRSQ
jgi:hypothetical protein